MKEGKRGEFRDLYMLGEKLGQGTFGMVYECTKKQSNESTVYAVKMMEHQSSWWGQMSRSQQVQWEMFAQEFTMLRKMEHPNVVKLFDVFADGHFLYFVMDKYESSLVEAVMPLLKQGKRAMPHACLGMITHQMLASIVYLHDQMIVHRDVKADNYLVDGKTFKGRDFKVVLTDLSTARLLEEGVFLKEMLGTTQYWAPEIAARSYAHKVDVWAIGVILWCMLTMKFPFNTVQETYTKKLTFRSEKMSVEQFAFLEQLLEKNPKNRLTARDAMGNNWLKESVTKHNAMIVKTNQAKMAQDAQTTVSEEDAQMLRRTSFQSANSEQTSSITVAKAGAAWQQDEADNALVFGQEKRVDQDAKQRLEKKLADAKDRFDRGEQGAISFDEMSKQQGAANAEGDHVAKDTQRKGEAKAYTWWTEERCVDKKVPDIQTKCDVQSGTTSSSSAREEPGDIALTEPSNVEQLEAQLKECNVDMSKWGTGKAKTTESLFKELDSIECRLLLRNKIIIRVVDYIVLRVKAPSGKLLVQVSQTDKAGTSIDVLKLPAVVRKAGGSGIDMARSEISRLIQEEIKADPTMFNVNMSLEDSMRDSMSHTEPSEEYPGLTTISRKTFFDATVNKSASAYLLKKFGLMGETPFSAVRDDGGSLFWEWWTPEQCKTKKVQLNASNNVLPEFEGFSPIVAGVWNEERLEFVLNQHNIDTKKFGVGAARSIAQFVTETNSGETRLFEKGKELRRHLDLLIVKIKNSFGAYLVETGHSFGKGQSRQRNAFPATKIRPFEDKVWAVRRLLREVDIPFSRSRIMFGPRRVEKQESPSYPGVTTVYLKQVVEVELEQIDVEALGQANMGASKWFRQKGDTSVSPLSDVTEIPI